MQSEWEVGLRQRVGEIRHGGRRPRPHQRVVCLVVGQPIVRNQPVLTTVDKGGPAVERKRVVCHDVAILRIHQGAVVLEDGTCVTSVGHYSTYGGSECPRLVGGICTRRQSLAKKMTSMVVTPCRPTSLGGSFFRLCRQWLSSRREPARGRKSQSRRERGHRQCAQAPWTSQRTNRHASPDAQLRPDHQDGQAPYSVLRREENAEKDIARLLHDDLAVAISHTSDFRLDSCNSRRRAAIAFASSSESSAGTFWINR